MMLQRKQKKCSKCFWLTSHHQLPLSLLLLPTCCIRPISRDQRLLVFRITVHQFISKHQYISRIVYQNHRTWFLELSVSAKSKTCSIEEFPLSVDYIIFWLFMIVLEALSKINMNYTFLGYKGWTRLQFNHQCMCKCWELSNVCILSRYTDTLLMTECMC